MNVEKRKTFLINFLYFIVIIGILYVLMEYVFELISPFLMAFLIAACLNKRIIKLKEATKINKNACAIIVVALFYIVLFGLITLVGSGIYFGARDFFKTLPQTYINSIEPFLLEIINEISMFFYGLNPEFLATINSVTDSLFNSLGAIVSSVSSGAVAGVSSAAIKLPMFVVKVLLTVIGTFFFATDFEKIRNFIIKQFPKKWVSNFFEVKKYVFDTFIYYVKSYGTILLITFIELTIGFTILGVENGVLIALVTAMLDIIPVLGTGGVLIPWGIFMIIGNEYFLGIGLLVLYALIYVIRNIIEPKIVGVNIGIPSVVALISMFVGAQVMGFWGLFIFPMSMSILVKLNEVGMIKLFKK